MPNPINENTIKLVWENNSDTPLTSSTLSKDVDFVASYRDFEFALNVHGEGSIFLKDNNIPVGVAKDQLNMKREVSIGLINLEDRIPVNKQYKIFDNGLEDLYIRVNDMDDNTSNPQPNKSTWGNNREWFIFLCDAENESSGQILVSLSNINPIARVLGNSAFFYTSKNTRMIGGFKIDGSGNIIEDSVWDISGKFQKVKAKKYYILDEYTTDSEDSHGRKLYRPLRLADLDTSVSAGNAFEEDVEINGDLNVDENLHSTSVYTDTLRVNGADTIIGIGTNAYPTIPSGAKANLLFKSDTEFRIACNDGSGNINFYQNSYYDSTSATHKYISTTSTQATRFTMTAGTFQFHIAPSSTAGNNITWSAPLSIDNTGVVSLSNTKIISVSQVDGAFDAGTTVPVHTTRLNYDGSFYATNLYATNLYGNLTGNVTGSSSSCTSIKTGSSTFTGNSTARTIAHGLGRLPGFASASPLSNPGGYLGEVWVTCDTTNIYVYNSGSAITAFTWIAY